MMTFIKMNRGKEGALYRYPESIRVTLIATLKAPALDIVIV